MKVALSLLSATTQQDVNIVIIGIRHVAPSWPTIMKCRFYFDEELLDTVGVIHTLCDILDHHPIPGLYVLAQMLIPASFRIVGNPNLDPPIIAQEE